MITIIYCTHKNLNQKSVFMNNNGIKFCENSIKGFTHANAFYMQKLNDNVA